MLAYASLKQPESRMQEKMVSGTEDKRWINVDSPYVFTNPLERPIELSRSDGVDETTPNFQLVA